MQDGPLMQCRPHRPVQSVFQIHGVLPLHNMRKQISEEGGILSEQGTKVKSALCGDQLIEPNLTGRHSCPVLGCHVSMVGVRASVANSFEDH